MTTKPTPPPRGGARPGAGRKPIGAEHETSVLLTAEQHAEAATLGDGVIAAGIRAALDQSRERRDSTQQVPSSGAHDSLLRRLDKLADDHERHEQGGGASVELREAAEAIRSLEMALDLAAAQSVTPGAG